MRSFKGFELLQNTCKNEYKFIIKLARNRNHSVNSACKDLNALL